MAQRKPSKLTRVVALLYSFEEEDVQALEEMLVSARKEAYEQTMTESAEAAGFRKAKGKLRADDLRQMRRVAKHEARQIADTYNKQVLAEIVRIQEANPRANRRTYFKQLEQWSAARSEHKMPQIAMMSDSDAAQYAQTQFVKKNKAKAFYRLEGASPKERECARLMALGLVDETIVNKNPMPLHINCPHKWKAVSLKVPPDIDKVFVG